MRIAVIARAGLSLLLVVGCSLAATGCSTTTADTATSAVAVAAASPLPTAMLAPAAAGSGANTAARCDMLTPADVQFLMTHKAIGPKVTPEGTDNDGQLCDFNNADVDQTVEVLVFPSSDPTFGYAAQKSEKGGAVSLPGIGEEAFREADDYDPTATGGGVTCTVSASIDDVPAAAALIVGGHSITLTPTQETAVAVALGTVCNRIFRSGNTTPDWSSLHS